MQHITYKYHQTSSLLTLTSHTSSYVLLFCSFIKNIIIIIMNKKVYHHFYFSPRPGIYYYYIIIAYYYISFYLLLQKNNSSSSSSSRKQPTAIILIKSKNQSITFLVKEYSSPITFHFGRGIVETRI